VTQEDWDAKWLMLYDRAWIEFRDHNKSFAFAHKKMLALHGPRPDGEPGPPWWTKVLALSLGVNMTKIWEFLAGKKLIIGAIITILASLAALLPDVLPVFGLDPVLTAKVVGLVTMILGLVHKFYNFVFKEPYKK
jgi:hypothetical protein